MLLLNGLWVRCCIGLCFWPAKWFDPTAAGNVRGVQPEAKCRVGRQPPMRTSMTLPSAVPLDHAALSNAKPRTMSRQRKRHLDRQPPEEAVRLSIAELIGNGGSVDVDRHKYDWRADDLLVWVRLKLPIRGAVVDILQQQLSRRMHELLPAGQPLGDWLLVAEHDGQTVFRTSWSDL